MREGGEEVMAKMGVRMQVRGRMGAWVRVRVRAGAWVRERARAGVRGRGRARAGAGTRLGGGRRIFLRERRQVMERLNLEDKRLAAAIKGGR